MSELIAVLGLAALFVLFGLLRRGADRGNGCAACDGHACGACPETRNPSTQGRDARLREAGPGRSAPWGADAQEVLDE